MHSLGTQLTWFSHSLRLSVCCMHSYDIGVLVAAVLPLTAELLVTRATLICRPNVITEDLDKMGVKKRRSSGQGQAGQQR